MLPWMCGRQTLTTVVSSPCMTQAQMTVAVIAARLAAVGALSPLTPPAFAVVAAWRRGQSSASRIHFTQIYRYPLPLVSSSTHRIDGLIGRDRYRRPRPRAIETTSRRQEVPPVKNDIVIIDPDGPAVHYELIYRYRLPEPHRRHPPLY